MANSHKKKAEISEYWNKVSGKQIWKLSLIQGRLNIEINKKTNEELSSVCDSLNEIKRDFVMMESHVSNVVTVFSSSMHKAKF